MANFPPIETNYIGITLGGVIPYFQVTTYNLKTLEKLLCIVSIFDLFFHLIT